MPTRDSYDWAEGVTQFSKWEVGIVCLVPDQGMGLDLWEAAAKGMNYWTVSSAICICIFAIVLSLDPWQRPLNSLIMSAASCPFSIMEVALNILEPSFIFRHKIDKQRPLNSLIMNTAFPPTLIIEWCPWSLVSIATASQLNKKVCVPVALNILESSFVFA